LSSKSPYDGSWNSGTLRTSTSIARSKTEECNVVWKDIDIITVQCQALSGLRDHVDCTDSAQAVDIDIGQRALKIDDVELAVLWAVAHIASCFKLEVISRKGFEGNNKILTCIVIVEE
jgi:hypothetical protein